MFAVIRTGGKQYKVAEKDILEVEKLDAKAGDKVELDVVMMSDGKKADMATKGKVTAKVVEQTRGDKVIVFKKKRRQGYRRTQGHRQDITVLEITNIKAA